MCWWCSGKESIILSEMTQHKVGKTLKCASIDVADSILRSVRGKVSAPCARQICQKVRIKQRSSHPFRNLQERTCVHNVQSGKRKRTAFSIFGTSSLDMWVRKAPQASDGAAAYTFWAEKRHRRRTLPFDARQAESRPIHSLDSMLS